MVAPEAGGRAMARRRHSQKRRAKRARRVARRRPRTPARAIEVALAGIAHDIRTPLTGIVALAELLASSNIGQRERDWANAIKSGADHLALLTTLIVDAAKGRAVGLDLRKEPFAPRALAEAVGHALAARAGNKGIGVEIAISDDLPAMVAGDVLRLRAVLENLADNAVKFTSHGTVTFRAEAAPARRGVRLIFTMVDPGIGIAAAELKKLFRPFAQASEEVSRRYGGAGLGLVFVRRIAELMGGTLDVSSEPGRGTTFRLDLPFERAAAPAAATSGLRSVPPRSLTLLCAEDNPYGRVVMNTILTELGHRIDFVEGGEAAVEAAARGGYDAVLMDVTLSGLDGIEATRRIRALAGPLGTVPIIGISGRNERSGEEAARAAGMNFFFAKPISPRKLAEALAKLSS